jgi:hypothetical protein
VAEFCFNSKFILLGEQSIKVTNKSSENLAELKYFGMIVTNQNYIHEDSRLTDGGEVVSLTRRQPFTPQEDSWYSFLLKTESTPGSCAVGRIKSIEKFSDLIGNRTRDLPASSIVPQPTTVPRAPRKRVLAGFLTPI